MKDAIDVDIQDSKMNFRVYEFMWRDIQLKGLELLVYAFIHQFPACYLTHEDMANNLGMNIKTLIKIIKELEAKRIILKYQIDINGNKKRNIYIAMIKITGRYSYTQAKLDIESAKKHLNKWYKIQEKISDNHSPYLGTGVKSSPEAGTKNGTR